MGQAIDQPLQEARDAVARHAWVEALEGFRASDPNGGLEPADLEGLAEAAWWTGDLATCIAARERAFAAHREAGDGVAAARVALELAHDYNQRGLGSMVAGWMSRAERILELEPESPQHGYFARMKAGGALSAGDLDGAIEFAQQTHDIGKRLADRNLLALGIHDKARALIRKGQVDEGLALMDEAMVAAVSGDLEPYPTGVIYCNAINICKDLADYGRAGQWTDAANRWCERQAISGFPGTCRVRKAEIVRLRGGWGEAEREARLATEELRDWWLEAAGWGFYEIGEIRLRMGDLSAAEDAFRQANEQGQDPQPGLALLRLAQGKTEAAVSGVGRTLDETEDRLQRTRILPASVQIAVAAGDLDAARTQVEELEDIVKTYDAPALRADAAMSRGRLHLAEDDAQAGVSALRRAWRLWREVDAPYEAAQARMLLGEAYRAAGDEDAATLELEAALAAFRQLGGNPEAQRVAGLLGLKEGGPPPTRQAVRTFLFTDIVRSTNLVEAIGDEAWTNLLRWHDQTLRRTFAAHGGEEVKHAGDGFFVAFDDPSSALECAVAIQRTLADHRKNQGFAPQVRIGLHAAPATKESGDYRGKGVHEAARIAALAEGGEILASEETAGGTRFPVSDPREENLKGIAGLVRVVSVEWT